MAVLEALSKYNNVNGNNNSVEDYAMNNEPIEDGSPEVYVRPSKEKELDLLWKDFRIPKGEHSPIVYLGIGFIAGIITTLAVSAFIGMSSGNFPAAQKVETSVEIATDSDTSISETGSSAATEITETSNTETSETSVPAKRFALFGSKTAAETSASETSSAQSYKEYEVQEGDTMEKIAKNFYGTYSPEKVDAIVKANNMKDANKLSIGQKLLIPSDGISENSAQ